MGVGEWAYLWMCVSFFCCFCFNYFIIDFFLVTFVCLGCLVENISQVIITTLVGHSWPPFKFLCPPLHLMAILSAWCGPHPVGFRTACGGLWITSLLTLNLSRLSATVVIFGRTLNIQCFVKAFFVLFDSKTIFVYCITNIFYLASVKFRLGILALINLF